MAKAINMPSLDWDAPTIRLRGESRAAHLRRYRQWKKDNAFLIATRNALVMGAELKRMTPKQRRSIACAFAQALGL